MYCCFVRKHHSNTPLVPRIVIFETVQSCNLRKKVGLWPVLGSYLVRKRFKSLVYSGNDGRIQLVRCTPPQRNCDGVHQTGPIDKRNFAQTHCCVCVIVPSLRNLEPNQSIGLGDSRDHSRDVRLGLLEREFQPDVYRVLAVTPVGVTVRNRFTFWVRSPHSSFGRLERLPLQRR
jgi:hypothetical protein